MDLFASQFGRFDSQIEEFQIFKRRFETFIRVSKIPENDITPLFILCLNQEAYTILCTLSMPLVPENITYVELSRLLLNYYSQDSITVDILSQRLKFYKLEQQPIEKVCEFSKRLLSNFNMCDFGPYVAIEDIKRDIFVSGLGALARAYVFAKNATTYSDVLDAAIEYERLSQPPPNACVFKNQDQFADSFQEITFSAECSYIKNPPEEDQVEKQELVRLGQVDCEGYADHEGQSLEELTEMYFVIKSETEQVGINIVDKVNAARIESSQRVDCGNVPAEDECTPHHGKRNTSVPGSKVTKAMTGAERHRRYILRIAADPAKKREHDTKERSRWHRRKAAGKVKLIGDMTDHEQRMQRKKWRENRRLRKEQKEQGKKAGEAQKLAPEQKKSAKFKKQAQRAKIKLQFPTRKKKSLEAEGGSSDTSVTKESKAFG